MSEKGLSDANDDIEDLVVLGLWFWIPIGLKSTLIQVIARETHIIAIRNRGSRRAATNLVAVPFQLCGKFHSKRSVVASAKR